MKSDHRPIVLIVRDGWGVVQEDPNSARRHGNAVALARLPVLDHLLATYPHALLDASGESVGLPAGQMGNSEVGHKNLGAGRVPVPSAPPDVVRITSAIQDGEFFRNPVLLEVMGEVRRNGTRLHLLGLVSDGGVHSQNTHLYALLQMAKQERLQSHQVLVHAILDGRDTPPRGGADYVQQLEQQIQRIGVGRIATVAGRYYAMDRDTRWERTARAYQAYVASQGPHATSAVEAIQASYAADIADEFVEPTILTDNNGQPIGPLRDGDGLIFFNFRPDRARQITRALTHSVPPEAPPETAEPRVSLHLVCMTQYDATIPAPVAFPPAGKEEALSNPLGQVVAQAGLRQLRIAETEKYAHVTYFFNGGREEPFPNEERALIPSPRVATYDLQPEMSAPGVTEDLLHRLAGETSPYDLVVLNFANPDMVGHTGILDPTVQALEIVDECIGRIVDRVRALGGITLITGDHGNAERMIADDGAPFTAHTTNPVHFILVDDERRNAPLRDGIFADVAPTILALMGLPAPPEMTGGNLLG